MHLISIFNRSVKSNTARRGALLALFTLSGNRGHAVLTSPDVRAVHRYGRSPVARPAIHVEPIVPGPAEANGFSRF
jgi:hypothetical protein